MGRELDNYYLILELDFLKPEEDDDVIMERLEEKVNFWNENCERDRKKGIKYKEYKNNATNIAKVMKTPNLRKAEAEDAKEFVSGILKEELRYFAGKQEIEKDIAEKISSKCGIGLDIFQKMSGMKLAAQGASAGPAKDPNPKVDGHNRFSKNEKNLKLLKRENLYDFLAEGNAVDAQALTAISGAKLISDYSDPLKERYKMARTDEGTVVRDLCAACEELFDSRHPEYKTNYDKYLQWKKIDSIMKTMDTISGSAKELDAAQCTMFISDLAQILKKQKAAEEKFADICAFLKIRGSGAVKTEKTLTCASCFRPVDISHGEKKCTHCGADLYIKCPSCGKEIPASAQACGFCSFVLENVNQVMTLCKGADQAIKAMEFGKARQYLASAESLWPKYDKIPPLKAALKKSENAIGEDIKKLNQLVNAKKFYAAKGVMDDISSRYPGVVIPGAFLVESACSEAQKLYKAAVSAPNEKEVIRLCAEITGVCPDYPVQTLILKYPPKPVSNLTVKCDGVSRSNTLTWTPSSSEGELVYQILRKENMASSSVSDSGARVLGTAGTARFVDSDVTPGKDYYYSVYTIRAGVSSQGVHQNAVNFAELVILQKEEGNGYVKMSWKPVENGAKVEVYRKENQAPRGAGDGTSISVMAGGFMDTGLSNDVMYGYYMRISYYLNGKTYTTEGITETAVPTSIPEPVEIITVQNVENDVFEAEWEFDGRETVIPYYTEGRNPFSCGDIVDKGALNKALSPLPVISSRGNSCRFKVKEKTKYIIVPVTIKNNTAVIGEQTVAMMREPLKITQTHIVGGTLRMETTWPDDTSSILLLYSNKKYPSGIDDMDGTTRRNIPKKAYELEGNALCIKNPAEEPYYIKIFGVTRVNGEQVYSECGQVYYDNSPLGDITYEIKVAGLFRSKHVEIKFTSTAGTFTLPEIAIVSCVDRVPVYINSGDTIYKIEEQVVNGSCVISIPMSALPKKCSIKPFFTDENKYDTIALNPAYGTNFKIN